MPYKLSLTSKFRILLMRFGMRYFIPLLWVRKKYRDISIKNTHIDTPSHDIPIRIYTPHSEQSLPLIIYFHGGGFVLGGLQSHHGMCSDLCTRSNSIVISVDYRLAPEHPFPCAPEDCFAATQWVIDNAINLKGDPEKIFVAGDSAGGNLAAVTAVKFSNHLRGQILIYPVLDHYNPGTASYLENAHQPGLTRELMTWFWDCYLINSRETRHPLATPLMAKDLSHLPDTLIIIAEKDPLRDEAVEYAKRLVEAGVKTRYKLFKGFLHGFIGTMGPSANHDKGMIEICNWLDELPVSNQ